MPFLIDQVRHGLLRNAQLNRNNRRELEVLGEDVILSRSGEVLRKQNARINRDIRKID